MCVRERCTRRERAATRPDAPACPLPAYGVCVYRFIATLIPTRTKAKRDVVLNAERPRLWYLQAAADVSAACRTGPQVPSGGAGAGSGVGAGTGAGGGMTASGAAAAVDAALASVKGFYVLAVFPGLDYVMHYARMVGRRTL